MGNHAFGWCFIGCGTLAGIVAEQITASGKHRIVSAYTRRFDACKEFTEKYGGTAYASAKEAILAPGVEGVYIVTPHSSHAEYAKLAIKCGKPVLCEKPFAMNTEQTEEVLKLAKEDEVYVAEAMWSFFSPVAKRVQEWMQSGAFGQVKECLADCRTNGTFAKRVTDPAVGGGAVLDVGVYTLYYMYKLFGVPEKIECVGDVRDGIDWSEKITLTYPGGGTFTALSSVNDDGLPQFFRLTGEKATLEIPGIFCMGHAEYTDEAGARHEITADGSYLNEFNIVADEIKEGLKESRYITHEDTRIVMGLLDECRRQMGLKYECE